MQNLKRERERESKSYFSKILNSQFLKITLTSLIAALACTGIIYAATTVGTNISTTGTLSVTASTTFNGIEYGWPSSDGSANQVLTTNSSGVLSWATAASGSGSLNYGAAGTIPFYSSAGTTATGTTNSLLYWDDTNARLGIGTSSPYAKLSVVGEVVGNYFTATSTTATSTFSGGFASENLSIGDGDTDNPYISFNGANNTGTLSWDESVAGVTGGLFKINDHTDIHVFSTGTSLPGLTVGMGTPVSTSLSHQLYSHGTGVSAICSDDTNGTGNSMACGVFITERAYPDADSAQDWNTGLLGQLQWTDSGINVTYPASAVQGRLVGSSAGDTATAMTVFRADIIPAGTGTINSLSGFEVANLSIGSNVDNLYGIKLPFLSGATNNWQIFSADSAGNAAFTVAPDGAVVSTSSIRVSPIDATQTIAGGNIITATACGGVAKIDSAALNVVTNTTNTFTAPSASNEGCTITFVNVGSYPIILDGNASFNNSVDVILDINDSITVFSTGAGGAWYIKSLSHSLDGGVWEARTEISSAALKDLVTNPVVLVPPLAVSGGDLFIEFISALLIYNAGATGYTEPSAPDDMVIKYKNSGIITSQVVDATDFITTTSDGIRRVTNVFPSNNPVPVGDEFISGKGWALRLHNTSTDYTLGDGTMTVIINYRVHRLGL